MKNFLIECVLGAGRILRDNFGPAQSVRRKESQSSVVTDTDLASERFLLDRIRRRFPGHNLLAEESGFENHGSDLTWVVDPLDGTSNFAAGLPWFGVMVAVLEGPNPVLAAMYLPVAETLYVSERGGGVSRNNSQVRVTADLELSNLLCAYGLDPSADPAETRRQAEVLAQLVHRARNLRATNSLVDVCYTLDGRFGAFLNHTTKIWDIAPACLMFPEAGGRLVDFAGREIVLDLGTACCQRNYAVIGASLTLLPQVLEIVRTPSP